MKKSSFSDFLIISSRDGWEFMLTLRQSGAEREKETEYKGEIECGSNLMQSSVECMVAWWIAWWTAWWIAS